jgi:cytochrome P450
MRIVATGLGSKQMGERKYDLYSDDFRATTYETFAAIREEDPILCQPGLDGETPIWFLTRYDDVVAMLLDDERFVLDRSNALTPEEIEALPSPIPPELEELINRHVLTTDGDDHRRLRRLVSQAFTPRMVERLRPRIQEIADELVDEMVPRGEADLVDSFAFPLPIIVIAELLGIPAEDRDRFRVWSNTFVSPSLGEDALGVFLEHTREFLTYLTELFERRRADPADDLVSALLQAEEQGDSLAENELFSMMILLIVAGHETTVSLIANSVLALLTHPEELEVLRNDPARIPAAVEELLRYDSPVERTITRWAATDVELGGHAIGRGDFVIGILGSANRDPARFADADTLDLDRADVRHVGFGRGRHFCLGAPLARLEAEIALTTLLRRLPGLRLAVPPESLRYRPVPLFRSLAELPVAW